MIKVITYGTYDLLHHGHIRLLERAKALGDYLIVGVTSDDFDKARGKINVQQSLLERIAAVEATGLADEIIVEEYEGQKIDDIRRCGVDIFTVGSDWAGKFDYLNEYCQVIYLPRTEGVSSSELRAEKRALRLGLVGDRTGILRKYHREGSFVNGLEIAGICSQDQELLRWASNKGMMAVKEYDDLLRSVDAVYIVSHPSVHFQQEKKALLQGKHVLCEPPIALSRTEFDELLHLAQTRRLILMDAIKTAYSTAYSRLLLLVKSGRIGKVLSLDATCTSLISCIPENAEKRARMWGSLCDWGPVVMLPVFQLFGTDYGEKTITTCFASGEGKFDLFTKIDFLYPSASVTVKVGKGIKSEGELILSGTKGYIYVPAPWWKTDYFELRYEDPANNKRYFYQLDGEGIRYELVSFVKAIEAERSAAYIEHSVSREIVGVIEDFYNGKNLHRISVG